MNKTIQRTTHGGKWLRFGTAMFAALVLITIVMLMPVIAARPAAKSATLPVMPLAEIWQTASVQAAGNLTITKAASPIDTVNQGSFITYTLIVTNLTDEDLNTLIVIDPVPADSSCDPADGGVIFGAFDDSGGEWLASQAECTQGQARWVYVNIVIPDFGNSNQGGSFSPGESVQLQYRVRVSEPLRNREDTITNSGYRVISSNPDYSTTGDKTVTNLVLAPEWSISKSVEPADKVLPGDRLTYTLTVANVGDFETSGFYTITETLPQHTSFVTATAPVSVIGKQLTWIRDNSLAIGQDDSVQVVVAVTGQFTKPGQIVNDIYSVSGGNVISPAVGEPVAITVDTPVTLTVRKADPDPVQAGALLTYTITVTNDTSSVGVAQGLIFTDAIPANTRFHDAGFSGGATGTTSADGSVVTWTVSSPAELTIGSAVQLTLTVQVESPLPNNTVITNSLYGATLSNTLNIAPAVPVTTTVQSSPRITLTKTVTPQIVVPGQAITYTIVVTNSGNETAINLPFTDAVRAPDFTPAQVTWALTVPGQNLAGELGVASHTVVFTAGATPGRFPNFVTTTVTSPIVIGPVATVTVRSPVDLQVKKARQGNREVVVGDAITYTLTITNAAGGESTDVIVTDTFSNAQLLTYSIASPPAALCDQTSAAMVVCNIPEFTNTTVITVVLDTQATISGVVTNTAVISTAIPGQEDPTPGNNRSVVTTPVRYPLADLQINKIRQGTAEIITGDTITYTLTVTNAAGSNTVPVVVTDIFTNAVFVSHATSYPGAVCGDADQQVTCTLPAFTGTTAITLVLDTTNSVSGTITNTAAITFADGIMAIDRIPSNNEAQLLTPARYPISDLQLRKVRQGSGTIIAGQAITYTITITNPVGDDVVDVIVTDTFTGSVASTSIDNNFGATCQGFSSPIVCNFDAFTNTAVLTVVLTTAPSFSGTLTNAAVVAAVARNTVDPKDNNQATVSDTVRLLQADLQISKTGPLTDVFAGNPVTYTITITNPGIDAVDVVVTDTFLNATVNSVEASNGGNCSGIGVGPISCTFVDFFNTAAITIVLNSASSQSPFTIDNVAEITATNPFVVDPDPDNNSSQVTTYVRPRQADLGVGKVFNGTSPVTAGERITFTLAITNAGPDLVRAQLSDLVTPASPVDSASSIEVFAPAGWDCTVNNSLNIITCNNDRFEIGSETITVGVTTSAAFAGSMRNDANIEVQDGVEAGEDLLPNSAGVELLIVQPSAPLLAITKTADPASGSAVTADQAIRYTVAVTNIGTAPAASVRITDSLDSAVVYANQFSKSNGADFNHTAGQITVFTSTLEVEQVLTASWVVTVTDVPSGTDIVNMATAASSATTPVDSNLVSHQVFTGTAPGPVYLPIIIKNCCLPNLIIKDFQIDNSSNPPLVTLVIENIGQASTGTGFWVDLYVNPNPEPKELVNASNPGDRRWQRVKTNVDRGIAWQITTPLEAGNSLALSSTSDTDNEQTKWTQPLPAGQHNFYAFVDSFDADDNPYVEIFETDEEDNQIGPVIVTLPASTAAEVSEAVEIVIPQPRSDPGR